MRKQLVVLMAVLVLAGCSSSGTTVPSSAGPGSASPDTGSAEASPTPLSEFNQAWCEAVHAIITSVHDHVHDGNASDAKVWDGITDQLTALAGDLTAAAQPTAAAEVQELADATEAMSRDVATKHEDLLEMAQQDAKVTEAVAQAVDPVVDSLGRC